MGEAAAPAKIYRRKPTEIIAFEFTAELARQVIPTPDGSADIEGTIIERPSALDYIQPARVRRSHGRATLHSYELWNKLHGSWVGLSVGHFIRIDKPGDVYPIDAKTFAETYEEVS